MRYMDRTLKELEVYIKELSVVFEIPDNWEWWDKNDNVIKKIDYIDVLIIRDLKKLFRQHRDERIVEVKHHAQRLHELLTRILRSRSDLREESKAKKFLVNFEEELKDLVNDLEDDPIYRLHLSGAVEEFIHNKEINDFVKDPIGFLKELNTISRGQESSFLGRVVRVMWGVVLAGEQWVPPKNKRKLIQLCIDKVIGYLRINNIELACGTIHCGLSFIHPFSNGNGRTSRLTSLFFLAKRNSGILNERNVQSFIVSSEIMRDVDKEILNDAVNGIMKKHGIRKLPYFFRSDGTYSPQSLASKLIILAYILVTDDHSGNAVHESNWDESTKNKVHKRYEQLLEEVVIDILENETLLDKASKGILSHL
jgi:prophage maintenance system killer protein|tara:strand:+ start:310 stop:1410 length:1101 start_codon:yes stop_codon:yes gene_type:complete